MTTHTLKVVQPYFEYSDQTICEGIAKAIARRDFQAVVPLLSLLASENPHLAQEVYDALTKQQITLRLGARSGLGGPETNQ